ncbi:hypothetical protein KCP70_10150 [Salmonella enterica subsp. enterica]|nr:hypothetical protein KCP70_10150 [Salmonella enterica subsp. enterica]
MTVVLGHEAMIARPSITPDAFCALRQTAKNECQVMPYPNPADIARMKEDKNINPMEQAGSNVVISPITCRNR